MNELIDVQSDCAALLKNAEPIRKIFLDRKKYHGLQSKKSNHFLLARTQSSENLSMTSD